jgi:hypothetical protein
MMVGNKLMTATIKIDFVSDIACPWCAVSLGNLNKAMAVLKDRVQFEVHFRAFELNPNMPKGGQKVIEHLTEEYGLLVISNAFKPVSVRLSTKSRIQLSTKGHPYVENFCSERIHALSRGPLGKCTEWPFTGFNVCGQRPISYSRLSHQCWTTSYARSIGYQNKHCADSAPNS